MPLESSITNSILRYLNSLPECRAEKLKGSSSASGRADINACYHGRSVRIEVKTPDHGNTTSAKQEHNLEKWYRAGAVVMVVYSLSAVQLFLKHIDNSHGERKHITHGGESWVKIPEVRQWK